MRLANFQFSARASSRKKSTRIEFFLCNIEPYCCLRRVLFINFAQHNSYIDLCIFSIQNPSASTRKLVRARDIYYINREVGITSNCL